MTEENKTTYDKPNGAVVVASDEPARAISAFTGSGAFETAQRMAKALCASTLVPKEYQRNIPNTLIAMELANRIGVSVLMAMQNLHVIHGRPGWSSTFLIATVNESGRFSPLRFVMTGEKGKSSRGCYAIARDKETKEDCEGTEITMAMADDEGWSKKAGSKWKTMPEQMLKYRAAAFWTRLYAPELSLGMHTAEEVADMQPTDAMAELPDALVPGSASDLEQSLVADAEPVDEDTGEVPADAEPTDAQLGLDT